MVMADRSSVSWQLLLVLTLIVRLISGSEVMNDTTTIVNSTNDGGTTTEKNIIIGAVIGAVVAIIIGSTMVLCGVISMKKVHKRKTSIDLTSSSKKSPNHDGYVNALYDLGVSPGDLAKDHDDKTVTTAVDSDVAKNSVRLSAASKTSKTSKSSKTSKTSKSSKTSKTSKTSKIDDSNSTINYDYASDGTKSPGSRSQCSLPSDVNVREKDRTNRDVREGSYEYAYATTSVDRISSSTSSSSVRSPQKRAFTGSLRQHSVRRENDHYFYVAPAMDENSLYAQFAEIRIKCLARETIKITDMIGSGQFGKVHQGEWIAPGSENKVDVAVKTLKEGAGEQDKIKFLQEAAIMGQFSHPNVVKLYGVVTEGEPVMIVLELLPKGDLRNHLFSIRNKHEEGDEHTLLSFCRQIAAGISYLASKSFVHRDLAARNILVSEDGICKIADFGMSRDLMDENYYISHGGKIPVKWTAPEALHFKKFSAASDVWSFGCVMYEIWSLGHKPFEGWSNNQTILEVDEGVRLAPPPGCPRVVYELAIQCWHPETSGRPSCSDIVQRFSLPDTKLLKWSEEDKATDPEAATLGADLDAGQELYKDLQARYISKKSANNNDLAASNATKHGSTAPTTSTSVTTPPERQSTSATVVTPTKLQTNALAAASAAGAHSYEDPSFLTLLPGDINEHRDLADMSDAEKGMIVVTVSGDGGYSYEDSKFVEALAEGNTVGADALSTNV